MFIVAQASDQVTIDARTLRAVWLLLAVLTVVLLWAFYELRRRRKLALRLDRLGSISGAPRYPESSARSPEDYEAVLRRQFPDAFLRVFTQCERVDR